MVNLMVTSTLIALILLTKFDGIAPQNQKDAKIKDRAQECAHIFSDYCETYISPHYNLSKRKNWNKTDYTNAVSSNHKTGTFLAECVCENHTSLGAGSTPVLNNPLHCNLDSTHADGSGFVQMGRRNVNLVRSAFNVVISGYFYHQHPSNGDKWWTHRIVNLSAPFSEVPERSSSSINIAKVVHFYNDFVQCMDVGLPLFPDNTSYISVLKTFPLEAGLILETFREARTIGSMIGSGQTCDFVNLAIQKFSDKALAKKSGCFNVDLDNVMLDYERSWLEVFAPALGRTDLPKESGKMFVAACDVTKNSTGKSLHVGNHSSLIRIEAQELIQQIDKLYFSGFLKGYDDTIMKNLTILRLSDV